MWIMDSKVPWEKDMLVPKRVIYIYITIFIYIYTYTGWWSVSSIFYFHLYLGKIHCPNGLKPPASSMQCFGWSTWEMLPKWRAMSCRDMWQKSTSRSTPRWIYIDLCSTHHTYLKFYIFYISMESMGLSLLWSSLPWDQSLTSTMPAKRSESLTRQSTIQLPYSFFWCTHPVLLGE